MLYAYSAKKHNIQAVEQVARADRIASGGGGARRQFRGRTCRKSVRHPMAPVTALVTELYMSACKWYDRIINFNTTIQPSTGTLYEPDVPFEKATFGMGCFWKSESLYGCVKGVLRTTAAYAGGTKKDPTYRSL